jgi:hypothetical protein
MECHGAALGRLKSILDSIKAQSELSPLAVMAVLVHFYIRNDSMASKIIFGFLHCHVIATKLHQTAIPSSIYPKRSNCGTHNQNETSQRRPNCDSNGCFTRQDLRTRRINLNCQRSWHIANRIWTKLKCQRASLNPTEKCERRNYVSKKSARRWRHGPQATNCIARQIRPHIRGTRLATQLLR